MQKLSTVFASLDPARRLFVVLAAVGTFAAVLALARGANAPSMALLYSGLEPAAAGEVIGRLETMGVVHDVRGDAIFVESGRRDALRLALAADGMPRGAAGYEILDNLSGFGTTAQMFDAAYWRAKEGELARTIQALPEVMAARVHIAGPDREPFSRAAPASASIVVTSASGRFPAAQARALRFMVASAVRGLAPEDVSVIDSQGGLIPGGGTDGPDAALEAGDRAASLRQNVERLLEARVGPGRAIVEVNVDTVTEREEIVERVFDPDSRVAISTITEETTSTAQDQRNGAVTVAGNLPDGDAGGTGANSNSQEAGTREQVNYEVSETQRELVRMPGAVRRLSVAVLIDGIRTVAADGTESWAPRPADELEALRELVASAVGFDEGRGDVITLRSLEFPAITTEEGSVATELGALVRLGLDPMRLVQIGVLAAVALVLGLFVVRPVLAADAPAALPAPGGAPGLPAPEAAGEMADDMGGLPPLDGEISDGFGDGGMPQMAFADGPFLGELDDSGSEDPAERLRQLADGRADETATIIRNWMEEREARA